MMRFAGRPEILLATEPVDMRKSINGLSVLVADQMECDPLNGSLFVFYNKARDKIKVLYWDRNGFCLWYKRLEKHRFHIPKQISGGHVTLSSEQLSWLLAGLEFESIRGHPELHFSAVK